MPPTNETSRIRIRLSRHITAKLQMTRRVWGKIKFTEKKESTTKTNSNQVDMELHRMEKGSNGDNAQVVQRREEQEEREEIGRQAELPKLATIGARSVHGGHHILNLPIMNE